MTCGLCSTRCAADPRHGAPGAVRDDRPGSLVSGCGEHQGDAGRREPGRAPWSKMPRSRLRRGRGHPWPRSSSNGLRRRVPRHGHGHRTEALWCGVDPWGRRLPKLRLYAYGPDLPRPGLLLTPTNHNWPVERLARTPWRTLAASISEFAVKTGRPSFRTLQGRAWRRILMSLITTDNHG
jgi:hypothetical protein